ncbi:MAG: aquaporin Z [Actinomycetia bacterium]|nr:aquaporin Z [Actinomycetes bacterium]
MGPKLVAEFFGTLWLVFGGCGSAVLAANFFADNDFPVGIGFLGVSFAFGLTVLSGAYAFGHVSGGHFNPAVTLGLLAGGKHSSGEVLPYIVAQVLGAIGGAGLLLLIANGVDGFEIVSGRAGEFATNGFGDLSPGGYSLLAALVIEVVLTAGFLMIILGATRKGLPAGFGPIAIGLALTLIHLISIPVTNTSVNPARSTGPALFVGGDNLSQLWLFWLAPIVGGVIGGLLYRYLLEPAEPEEVAIADAPL